MYLFQKLLFTLLVDDGVGVAHHGDQHVEEKNRNQNLEENEHRLCHAGVSSFTQFVILKKAFKF
jgi:hypothetical protein